MACKDKILERMTFQLSEGRDKLIGMNYNDAYNKSVIWNRRIGYKAFEVTLDGDFVNVSTNFNVPGAIVEKAYQHALQLEVEEYYKSFAREEKMNRAPGLSENYGLEETDDLVEGADKSLLQADKKKLDSIRRTLRKFRAEFKKENDAKELESLKQDIIKLEALEEGIRQDIAKLKDLAKDGTYAQLGVEFERYDEELNNLLSNKNITYDGLDRARNISNVFIHAANTFHDTFEDGEEHIFFTKDELKNSRIKEIAFGWSNKMMSHKAKIKSLEKDILEGWIETTRGIKLTLEEKENLASDIGFFEGQFLNLGRNKNPLLQTVFNDVDALNTKVDMAAQSEFKDIDGLFEAALPTLKRISGTNGNLFEVFRQVDKDGLKTGKLVHEYTPNYIRNKYRLLFNLNNARRDLETYRNTSKQGEKESIYKDALKKYNTFIKDNVEVFNPLAVLTKDMLEDTGRPYKLSDGDTSFDKDAYKAEWISKYGQQSWNKNSKMSSSYIYQFIEEANAHYDKLKHEEGEVSSDSLKHYTSLMNKKNPLKAAKDFGTKDVFERFIVPVAKPGKDRYDQNYQTIQSNTELLQLHDKFLSVIKESSRNIGSKADFMGPNYVPHVEKSVMEMFAEQGSRAGIKGIMSSMRGVALEKEVGATDLSERDVFGEKENQIQLHVVKDSNTQINNMVNLRYDEFVKQHGEPQKGDVSKIKKNIRKEVVDEMSNEASWDLVKIMKMMSLESISYKHKAAIHTKIKLAERFIKENKAASENVAGEKIKSKDGKLLSDKLYKDASDAMDFFLASDFYGTRTSNVGPKIGGKKFSKDEAAMKRRYEDVIEHIESKLEDPDLTKEGKAELEEKIKEYKAELKKLGGYVTTNTVGDGLLIYAGYLSLGWNLFSATSNMTIGYLSNMIEAADGRMFDTKELHRGYALARFSVMKNFTFDSYKHKEAIKLRSLMDKSGISSNTVTRDISKTSVESSYSKHLKRFGPMNLQERTEYLNMAPVLIAMADRQKVFYKGEEKKLWELYDDEGNLPEGITIKQQEEGGELTEVPFDEVKFIQKVKSVIQGTHGDYMNSLGIKKATIGRLATQFRRWMLEGWAGRFETERWDSQRQYYRKGRYKSFAALWENKSPMETTQNVLHFMLQILKAPLFGSNFDKKYSEVDSANLRKSAREITMLLAVMGLQVLTKAAYEDDEEANGFVVYYMNQMSRLESDLWMFYNPAEFQNLNKNIIPAMRVITQIQKLVDAGGRYLDDRDTTIQSGPFEGMGWVSRRTLEMFPGLGQILRTYRDASVTYDSEGRSNVINPS